MHRRDFIKLTAAFGAATSLPLWSRAAFASEMPRLPIPPLLAPDANRKIQLRLQTGSMLWVPGQTTQTWGINGGFLGTAIRLQRGKPVTIEVNNTLPEATTVHWHGLEIPGEVDGGASVDRSGSDSHRVFYRRSASRNLLVPSAYA